MTSHFTAEVVDKTTLDSIEARDDIAETERRFACAEPPLYPADEVGLVPAGVTVVGVDVPEANGLVAIL